MYLSIITILSVFLFHLTALYNLGMLQQNSYNENKAYLNYVNKDLLNNNVYYTLINLLITLGLFIINKMPLYLYIIYVLYLLGAIFIAFKTYKKHNQKLPLKFTKRVKRILLCYCLWFILIMILGYYTLNFSSYCALLLLTIILSPYILMFIVILLKPVEKKVFNHYKKEALVKLNKMKDLKIIGITGSFGKTSTKMILNSILNTTYKGFYTPASFNTPNGLLITINNEKTIFNDYFISEMGAKKEGEIKELCDLVNPSYGILTSIGPAHLETFKSMENICKTKFELIESLPDNGVGILNKDDEYQRNYKLKNNCQIIWIGIENDADVVAKDIKISSKGTNFKVYFKKDKKEVEVSTILLGNKNVYNILAACALANYLGVNDKNIQKGVSSIKAIEHRLELKNLNNITILDDSFNSNPIGAKNALDVLAKFTEKKIIITPGMVEMGAKQEELNFTFGTQIAKVCDEVYLVGKKQTKPIYDGLIKEKYDSKKIHIASSFNEAFASVKNTSNNKKLVVLLENDLPDSYTEGK